MLQSVSCSSASEVLVAAWVRNALLHRQLRRTVRLRDACQSLGRGQLPCSLLMTCFSSVVLRVRGGALRSLSDAVRALPPSSSSPSLVFPKMRMSPAFNLSAFCMRAAS